MVGEDENHLFSPLATFISNLIKNREDEPKTLASDKVRPVRGLAVAAAGEDEPDYTTARLISVNPDYEDPSETWETGARPVRGLAVAAAGEDEPDYTTARLISVNPDYEDSSETWETSTRPVRGLAEKSTEAEHDSRTKLLTKGSLNHE